MASEIEKSELLCAGAEFYAVAEDEDSNRFHFQWAKDGDVHIVDIQGWFRDLVEMPGIEEVDAWGIRSTIWLSSSW